MNPRALIATLLAFGCSGCLSKPIGMPRHVFASYKDARPDDFIGRRVAFFGTFERVSAEPFLNVHGREWGALFRVKEVFFDSWDKVTFSFNISAPEQKRFEAGKDYYVIALHTRHGFYLHDAIPAAEKPNSERTAAP